MATKKAAKLSVLRIPAISPDLIVCEYALRKDVNKKMRARGRGWGTGKRESRAEYILRLQSTAKRLSSKLVKVALGNMKERCQRLYEARSGLFEEGGLPRFSQ